MIWDDHMRMWRYHGGTMFTLDMEYELGFRAAFDLFHLDDVMFGDWV